MPIITIESPNAKFYISFDREASACWMISWPDFAHRPNEYHRSLEIAMGVIADFVVRTEF